MTVIVFWVLTPCGFVRGYQHFEEIYFLRLRGGIRSAVIELFHLDSRTDRYADMEKLPGEF
jgi:hypothetical protein